MAIHYNILTHFYSFLCNIYLYKLYLNPLRYRGYRGYRGYRNNLSKDTPICLANSTGTALPICLY